jgi:hypothetical protein
MCAKTLTDDERQAGLIDYWRDQVSRCHEDNGFFRDAKATLEAMLNPAMDFQI